MITRTLTSLPASAVGPAPEPPGRTGQHGQRRRGRRALLLAGVIVAVGLLGQGCGGDDKGTNPPNPPDSLMVQDFHLEDINPNSSRYQQQVSPRDYLGRLTAWYFGSAG